VVKEISQACRKQGLKFGIYLSPWDRNSAIYGTPAYITYYRHQLTELLTGYGPISEVWFDGANGGDGYYGGTRETRSIDNKTYYDWPTTIELVRRLQPMACMFSDAGPDIRWVGNEGASPAPVLGNPQPPRLLPRQRRRKAPQSRRPSRNRLGARRVRRLHPARLVLSPQRRRQGENAPRNCWTSIFKSVGRGATMLLNIPPDQRGQIHETDIASLQEFARRRDAIFAVDLARHARVTASNVRGQARRYRAENVIDGKRDTYWATDDGVTNADLVLEFPQPVTFNVVRLREYLPLGQRVEGYVLEQWQDGQWKEFASGASIGSCRLVRGADVTTSKVRLRITRPPSARPFRRSVCFTRRRNRVMEPGNLS
jgi:alpha-L-fucosidase